MACPHGQVYITCYACERGVYIATLKSERDRLIQYWSDKLNARNDDIMDIQSDLADAQMEKIEADKTNVSLSLRLDNTLRLLRQAAKLVERQHKQGDISGYEGAALVQEVHDRFPRRGNNDTT